MGIFNFFRRSNDGFGSNKAAAEPAAQPAPQAPRYEPGDYSLFPGSLPNTEGAALRVSTVYRCVKLISDSVAQLPIRCIRTDREGVDRIDRRGRLPWLLSVEPSPNLSSYDMWAEAVQQMHLQGNAYIVPIIEPGERDYSKLVLCRPSTVRHDLDRDVYHINDTRNGVCGEFGPSEVIHLKGLSTEQRTGQSVLEYARHTLDVSWLGELETKRRFRTGGTQRVLVGGNAAAAFADHTDDYVGDLARDLEGALLSGRFIMGKPGDVTATTLSMSSSDMQFLETRKFTVRDICRFFGVHPSFVFDDTSNNYKSAENANAAFLSNTLNPLLVRIENELRRKLCTPGDGRRFEFDRRAMLATDLSARMDYLTRVLATGTKTVNELRRSEGLPSIDGGDVALVSANLRPLSELSNPLTPAINENNE